MTLFHFSASRYIIGKKGETKKRLETETRTSISIPKPGVEGEIGEPKTSVLSAALTQTRFEGAQGTGGAFLQFLLLAQHWLTSWPWGNHLTSEVFPCL